MNGNDQNLSCHPSLMRVILSATKDDKLLPILLEKVHNSRCANQLCTYEKILIKLSKIERACIMF